jgi:hypothetical protein
MITVRLVLLSLTLPLSLPASTARFPRSTFCQFGYEQG